MSQSTVVRLPGRFRRRMRRLRGPIGSLLVLAACVLWVVWLAGLPTAAREAEPTPSTVVVVSSIGTPPATDAPEPAPGPPVRDRPVRDPGATADVVVALASVLALTEDEAKTWAEASGYVWRVTWRDGTAFVQSFDYLPERLNLEIADGLVVYAWFG